VNKLIPLIPLAATVLSWPASPSLASFALIDDPVFGPASLVLDTTTSLEWLRAGFAPNGTGPLDVLAQMGPGAKYAGFAFAGTDNWAGLMTEFALPTHPGPPDCWGDTPCSVPPAAESDFTGLFGVTLGAGIDYATEGVVGRIQFDGVFFLSGQMEYSGFTEGCTGGGVNWRCGEALVRDPPAAASELGTFGISEPSTLGLLGLALGWLGFLRVQSALRRRGVAQKVGFQRFPQVPEIARK
jgi:hypothetical protein